MFYKIFFTVLFTGIAFTCQNVAAASFSELIKAKVISVTDGDTIDIRFDDRSLTIRLEHVDCPEVRHGQPFGKAAKQFTSDLCFGQNVKVFHANKYDRYKRLIAVVINERGENVNKKLVQTGLAWHFKRYSIDTVYAKLEESARQSKVNIWSQPNPIAPWNWRKPKKH